MAISCLISKSNSFWLISFHKFWLIDGLTKSYKMPHKKDTVNKNGTTSII